jgi:phosphoserine phosphatase
MEASMTKKLLVCDVEGTIFKPARKDVEHASYIWAALAKTLGSDAIREEMYTHKKWSDEYYGPKTEGTSYIEWVEDTIRIHQKYHITEEIFNGVITKAPYYEGVVDFFTQLDRTKYIPILISGGIEQLSEKACIDLHIDPADSYTACSYFFDEKGHLDTDLTFVNTSNFWGKQELVKLALWKK